ncbi:hypothetical protein C8R45DRAFT_941663 [Mycena sanguinolenta]|nr:hypothetical protein C8R45DRAFT_941663 [Mycena sanguinolenta]
MAFFLPVPPFAARPPPDLLPTHLELGKPVKKPPGVPNGKFEWPRKSGALQIQVSVTLQAPRDPDDGQNSTLQIFSSVFISVERVDSALGTNLNRNSKKPISSFTRQSGPVLGGFLFTLNGQVSELTEFAIMLLGLVVNQAGLSALRKQIAKWQEELREFNDLSGDSDGERSRMMVKKMMILKAELHFGCIVALGHRPTERKRVADQGVSNRAQRK